MANLTGQTLASSYSQLLTKGTGGNIQDGLGVTYFEYVTGTFTPTVTFGGGSTGLTTSTITGRYTRIGNVCYYYATATVTNKGSSTGNILIGNLPYTSLASSALFATGVARSVSGVTFTAPLYSVVLQGTTNIALFDNNAGAQQQLTDADFSSSFEINVTGFYFVA